MAESARLLAAVEAEARRDDQWRIWDAEAGIHSGYGINGQQLLIHRPTRTVIARLSTWPDRWDDRLARYGDVANMAVLRHLAAVQRH